MTTTQKVKAYILANKAETDNAKLAKGCDSTAAFIAKCKSELRSAGKLAKYDPSHRRKIEDAKVEQEKTIEEKVDERRDKTKIKLLQEQNKRLLSDYDKLMEQYDNALLVKENTNAKPLKITLNTSIASQATPIIQWSDWHLEERIEKKTTRGLNEYNPDIASKRVDTLALNTLKIVKKERQDVKINQIVVCLGGDFINNFLHEHDVQMNFMHPIEATIFAKNMLVKALSTLAKNGDFKKIYVPCIRGNHGRLTKRMQSSNDYKMNLEAVLYYMLKQELNDSIFEFQIPESELGYIEVYDKKIRIMHGHQINYQGGVGDITIPVNKFIMKQDKTEKADWNLMHHYHRFWMPTGNTSLNGSLCGWNSYALSCGFPFEPPLQAFHLLDAKRGFTVRTPIFCQ